ncbi:unnamed protein product [Oppiella nova]|uniref:DNA-directed RNA polymerase I subunit D n=1 Tax=Oppiella nova TaxID=334625 RepID=A0A7R9LZ48_9ACAR|nr:unnamed protein product [Oppiella nova]CAG2168404.1 unnamed protein product [Oppiella nova]
MSAQTKSRFEVIEMTNGGECAIIALTDEDHTLANALRYVIVKNSNVQFCGYSLPHPNDNVVLLQIQMKSGLNAINALEKGFRDLMDSCQHIKHSNERLFAVELSFAAVVVAVEHEVEVAVICLRQDLLLELNPPVAEHIDLDVHVLPLLHLNGYIRVDGSLERTLLVAPEPQIEFKHLHPFPLFLAINGCRDESRDRLLLLVFGLSRGRDLRAALVLLGVFAKSLHIFLTLLVLPFVLQICLHFCFGERHQNLLNESHFDGCAHQIHNYHIGFGKLCLDHGLRSRYHW